MNEADRRARRFGADVSLRRKTARGSLINGAYLTVINGLAMARGLLMAAFLAPDDYAIWGILVVMVATLQLLRNIGISDRFVQLETDDPRREFRRAFTLELATASTFTLIGVALVAGASAVYDIPELLAPGLLMLAALPLQAFGLSLAIFYRRMDFVRQRALQSAEPLVAFVVTLGLAFAGAGYWSLVIGTTAGSLALALVAFAASPYRFGLLWERSQLRGYLTFSWPIFFAGLTSVVTAQGLVAAGNAAVGLAGIGIIALCAQISQFADRADRAVTDTIYPALCAVPDRVDLLLESFVTSNRLVLMWSLPFGAGVALFADDLLTRVLDGGWGAGVGLLQATSVALALHQVGFNWTAFYRARGDTRPIAAFALVGMVVFGAVTVPLLLIEEMRGLAWAVLISEVIFLTVRAHFLRRLFGREFSFVGHLWRSVTPTLPAVAIVLAMRPLEPDHRTLAVAAVEAIVFVAVAGALTWWSEADLLRRVAGYVRGGEPGLPGVTT